jgi:hypothetical protein
MFTIHTGYTVIHKTEDKTTGAGNASRNGFGVKSFGWLLQENLSEFADNIFNSAPGRVQLYKRAA